VWSHISWEESLLSSQLWAAAVRVSAKNASVMTAKVAQTAASAAVDVQSAA
jgi:hypothetical protein